MVGRDLAVFCADIYKTVLIHTEKQLFYFGVIKRPL